MPARPPLSLPLSAAAAFSALLSLILIDWAPLDRFDSAVSQAFREYGASRPALIAVLRIGTDLAATVPFLTVGLVLSVALLVHGRRRPAAFTGAVCALVPLLWILMHLLLVHPRPAHGFVPVHGNSFPSGHTSNAATLALLAVLLLWPLLRRPGRVVVLLLAGGLALVIGVTRMALLAHWPTDILGGWLLALTVVPLAARVTRADVPTSAVCASGH